MGALEDEHIFGIRLRESADDGSDFSNPDADYRIVFLGEDGLLHARDSSGTVTGLGGTGLTNPMTTQDDIIVGGASGTPGRLAKGTDGQILTVDPSTHHLVWANNSGVADILDLTTAETDDTLVLAPDGAGGVEFRAETGGGGGGGGPTPLGTYTASASATLDLFTRNASGQSGALIQGDFSIYELIFAGFQPATNNVEFILRMATGGTPTVDSTSAHYSWIENRNIGGASAAGGASADGIRLAGSPDNVSNDAAFSFFGRGTLINPNPGTIYPDFQFLDSHKTGGGSHEQRIGDGRYLQTTSITALQLLMSSGNITVGTVYVFGVI